MRHLLLIGIILLASCSAASKSKIKNSEVKVETEKKDIALEESRVENVKTITDKLAEKVTLEPVDPKLPSKYEGREFQNTRVVYEKEKEKVQEVKKVEGKTKLGDKTETKVKEKAKALDKKVKRSPPYWAFALGVVILMVIFPGIPRWVNSNLKRLLRLRKW